MTKYDSKFLKSFEFCYCLKLNLYIATCFILFNLVGEEIKLSNIITLKFDDHCSLKELADYIIQVDDQRQKTKN